MATNVTRSSWSKSMTTKCGKSDQVADVLLATAAMRSCTRSMSLRESSSHSRLTICSHASELT